MNRHRRLADYSSREAVDYADYPDEQLTDVKILDYTDEGNIRHGRAPRGE